MSTNFSLRSRSQDTASCPIDENARAVDVVGVVAGQPDSGRGKVYILEYSRPITSGASYALPGRILELAVKP